MKFSLNFQFVILFVCGGVEILLLELKLKTENNDLLIISFVKYDNKLKIE